VVDFDHTPFNDVALVEVLERELIGRLEILLGADVIRMTCVVYPSGACSAAGASVVVIWSMASVNCSSLLIGHALGESPAALRHGKVPGRTQGMPTQNCSMVDAG